MFTRKDPPKDPPEVTNEIYSQWLRAQRPPFEFFLGLSSLERDQLALMGEEYVQDVAIALGLAMKHPEDAADGVAALRGDENGEASLALRLAQNLAMASPDHSASQAPQSLSGGDYGGGGDMASRLYKQASQRATPPSPSFMGKAPDESSKEPVS